MRSVNPSHCPHPQFQVNFKALTLIAALALSACSEPVNNHWSGYAESDPIFIAAPVAGRLKALHVHAGDAVAAGDALFALDDVPEQADRARAQAQLSQAQAQARNLDTGRRDAELAVTRAQLAQAQAQLREAAANHQRLQALQQQHFISSAQVETAAHTRKQAAAKVAELEAALRAAQLPARAAEREASDANIAAATQALRAQDWRVQETRAHAPVAAQVEDSYFRVGEWVAAGQAVVALRGATGLKVRFFVPEGEIAALKLGQTLQLSCDACPPQLQATVSRIASAPEYTPPVIYSNAQRAKLVFAVEATLPADARVHPGQPVDVQRVTADAAPRS